MALKTGICLEGSMDIVVRWNHVIECIVLAVVVW